jgi:hypothetical protein
MFDAPGRMLLGLAIGIVFGVLLQKGRVAKFPVIVGQLLLRDWTVLKIMLTAMAVGSVGVYALNAMGLAGLHVKPAVMGGVLAGGLLFGVGMAILGYCPGTTVAACGEGSRDAVFGLVGLLAGAAVYVVAFPWWQTVTKAFGDLGKITLPQVTATPAWIWIAGLAVMTAVLYRLLTARPVRTRP